MEKINFIVFVRANKRQCDTSRLAISRKKQQGTLGRTKEFRSHICRRKPILTHLSNKNETVLLATVSFTCSQLQSKNNE